MDSSPLKMGSLTPSLARLAKKIKIWGSKPGPDFAKNGHFQFFGIFRPILAYQAKIRVKLPIFEGEESIFGVFKPQRTFPTKTY